MSNDEMSQATITRSGEVEFPSWVKVLAWIVGLSFPVAVLCAAWIAGTIWDMRDNLTEISTEMRMTRGDQYGAAQANAVHEAMMLRVERNEREIRDLQGLHGRDKALD